MALIKRNTASNDDRFDEYSTLSLQQVDEAHRVPGIHGAPLHVEQELDAFGREQLPLWTAEGIVAAREAFVEHERLEAQRWSAACVAEGDMRLVVQARRHVKTVTGALGPFVRRKAGQRIWFLARTGLLLLGDVAGQAGAQIYYGEIPELALIQSLAAGVAVVTSGLVGSEVKDLRMGAKRKAVQESQAQSDGAMSHMFHGVDEGSHFVRALVFAAATVGLLISAGIFGLRTAVEDPLAGLVYGAIAAGVATASFISSYVYADEAADAIDHAERAYEKAIKRQLSLAAIQARSNADAAGATYMSVRDEFENRGHAASIAHEGLKHRVLRRNPGIAGHSPALDPEPIVGSRSRLKDGD